MEYYEYMEYEKNIDGYDSDSVLPVCKSCGESIPTWEFKDYHGECQYCAEEIKVNQKYEDMFYIEKDTD